MKRPPRRPKQSKPPRKLPRKPSPLSRSQLRPPLRRRTRTTRNKRLPTNLQTLRPRWRTVLALRKRTRKRRLPMETKNQPSPKREDAERFDSE
jgi:hypothetical protein